MINYPPVKSYAIKTSIIPRGFVVVSVEFPDFESEAYPTRTIPITIVNNDI